MRITINLLQNLDYTKKDARLVTGVLSVDLSFRPKSEAASCSET